MSFQQNHSIFGKIHCLHVQLKNGIVNLGQDIKKIVLLVYVLKQL